MDENSCKPGDHLPSWTSGPVFGVEEDLRRSEPCSGPVLQDGPGQGGGFYTGATDISGNGTTGKIPKWQDGPNGVLTRILP